MRRNVILTIIFILGSLIIYFWVIPYFTKPVGVPIDFYEISKELNESDMNIYYYGDKIPFNERVNYITVEHIEDVPFSTNPLKAVVIDFTKSDFTEDEYEYIISLYKDNCYRIILINYSGSELNSVIDFEDQDKKFIFLDFHTCGGELYFSNPVDLSEETDQQTWQYITTKILHKETQE